MQLKRIIYIIVGCIGVGLGAVGAALPMIPAFPFLLLATFCFARSSERLHTWFINTRLYKSNLESFLAGQGMTRQAKARVMVTITLLMSFGFVMMLLKGLYIPCIILFFVWVFHMVYFAFGVKKYTKPKAAAAECK